MTSIVLGGHFFIRNGINDFVCAEQVAQRWEYLCDYCQSEVAEDIGGTFVAVGK